MPLQPTVTRLHAGAARRAGSCQQLNAGVRPLMGELSMKLISFCILLLLLAACVSTTPEGAAVRVTSNPDVVKGCQFLGNVKATSGWGGPAGTGLGTSNTEKTLQNKTAKLGGNVVFVTTSGVHAIGEAYKCPPLPSQP